MNEIDSLISGKLGFMANILRPAETNDSQVIILRLSPNMSVLNHCSNRKLPNLLDILTLSRYTDHMWGGGGN